jgi:hypothetical protein
MRASFKEDALVCLNLAVSGQKDKDLVIYPINLTTLAQYREAFSPSRRKLIPPTLINAAEC